MKNFVLLVVLMGLCGWFQGCAEDATDSSSVTAETESGGDPGADPVVPGPGNTENTIPNDPGADPACVDEDGDGQYAISDTCKQGTDCDDANPEVQEGCAEGDDSCTPDCEGKTCGPDGCGATCGTCEGAGDCNVETGQCCAPDCEGKECGDNGCGGLCGTCDVGAPCNADGICAEECVPDCAGKTCGSDGCGGDCGACGDGEQCNPSGACECAPACDGKQCGDDGCGGDCGPCGPGAECSPEFQCDLITAGDESCADLGCGDPENPEVAQSCYCDQACFGYGDCCSDICDVCGDDYPAQCACEDADGDLYGEGPGCLGPDCDDTNANVFPGANEVCGNAIDDDCDTLADEGCDEGECLEGADEDGDGFYDSAACEYPDCDDNNENVYPGAEEVCGDGIDNNCVNGVDEVALCPASDCIDEDGDGYGVGDGCIDTDCNDSNPFQNPGIDEAEDICGDGVDQDCSGDDPVCPEECVDADGDGYYAIVDGCEDGKDCDDGNKAVNPGVDAEGDICGDGIDQDCSGSDAPCGEGECTSDANCDDGQWCDLSQTICVTPKYWQVYAPEIWLETDEDGKDLDFFTTVDFDLDNNAANNPENASLVAKDLKVYYSYVKTETHAYVGYHFYFPKRWSDAIAFGTNYDNTMRHVLLVIDIGADAGVYGTVQAMFTTTESIVREYTNEDVALEGNSDGNILWSDVNGVMRPRIYIDSENHNIAGNPEDVGFKLSDEDVLEFPDDTGYQMSWGWIASTIEPAPEGVEEANLSGTETYALVEMLSELWPERDNLGETTLFETFGVFSGEDTTNDSTAPWAFEENGQYPAGELLWDPATFAARKFYNGWGDFSRVYAYNPYVLKVTLVDLKIEDDSELFGDPEPYINLYLRDGKGDEHKVLGWTGGAQNNWNPGGTEPGTIFYLQDAMDRNWFYGLDVTGTDYIGLEVREKDIRGDDWLMIPGSRYFDSFTGSKELDFLNSTMNVEIELP